MNTPEDFDLDEFVRAGNEAMAARQRQYILDLHTQRTPPRYRAATLTSLPASTAEPLADWIANPTRNLAIIGPVGAGKTHAAWATLRAGAEAGLTVRGIGASSLIDSLKPGGNPLDLERLVKADVLFIDDIGSERSTDFAMDRMYAIVNERWEHERPMITTSNLTRAALEVEVGSRTASRLFDGALVIKVVERNYRKDPV